ncbi:hypothetical protein MBLNU13_g08309t1 [Cladosporium sp. NU13]
MAFRRSNVDIPQEVTFPENMHKLGFTGNLRGQIVDKTTGEFFNFEEYENERTNQLRYHATHKAVRKELHRVLTGFGVKTRYMLEDDEGLSVVSMKPESPSICILTSAGLASGEDKDFPLVVGDSKNSAGVAPGQVKELYLVVGDSKQDLGILSRKAVLTEGGLACGSVLGLVAALRGRAMPEMVMVSDVAKPSLPDVVVFNSGELLWSNKTQECMSGPSWHDREHKDGFSDQYVVTDKYNRILSHETPAAHVGRCLHAYLGHSAGPDTDVNIITIGDGSEHVLSFLKAVYANARLKAKLGILNINIAMVSPSHNDDFATDPALKRYLAKHSRIWESHSLPKGTRLSSTSIAKFSAGVEDTADMIFPKVQGDVLKFFEEKSG